METTGDKLSPLSHGFDTRFTSKLEEGISYVFTLPVCVLVGVGRRSVFVCRSVKDRDRERTRKREK